MTSERHQGQGVQGSGSGFVTPLLWDLGKIRSCLGPSFLFSEMRWLGEIKAFLSQII
jgi:hypothetical protein